MAENSALLAAIIAHPAEDTPRLAYADWLDENGEPERARFIRLQYEIEKLPPIGLKASKAKKEEEALLKKHEKEWAGPVAGLVDRCIFRRGFVECVRVTVAKFLQHGEPLFQLAPLREVRLTAPQDLMSALVASPLLGRVEMLDIGGNIMDQLYHGDRFELLINSPQLAVRWLSLSMNSLRNEHAEQLARCPHLGSLAHLDLSWNALSAAGLRAVANSEKLPALTSLTVQANGQVNADGMRAIVDSPLADRLEHLCVAYTHFGDAPVAVLAQAGRLKRLRTLDLSNNDLTDAAARALEAAEWKGLERLTLRGHRKTIGKEMRTRLQKRFGKNVCVF